jgi:hypothetical protein
MFILFSHLRLCLPSGLFPSGFATENLIRIPLNPHARYLFCPILFFLHLSGVHVIKLLITQFSPPSCHFIPLRSEYSYVRVLRTPRLASKNSALGIPPHTSQAEMPIRAVLRHPVGCERHREMPIPAATSSCYRTAFHTSTVTWLAVYFLRRFTLSHARRVSSAPWPSLLEMAAHLAFSSSVTPELNVSFWCGAIFWPGHIYRRDTNAQ